MEEHPPQEKQLNNFLLICTEGPDLEHFDAIDSLKLWVNNKLCRPHQSKCKSYKALLEKEKPNFNGRYW